jgi:hypothetical protein
MKLTPDNLRYLSSVAKTDVMKSHLAAAADLIEKLHSRIAELEAVIKQHGIPVKTFSGGEAHYCTKEES